MNSNDRSELLDLERGLPTTERDVQALRAKARASAERQLRALLVTLGFKVVHFVETLPGPAST